MADIKIDLTLANYAGIVKNLETINNSLKGLQKTTQKINTDAATKGFEKLNESVEQTNEELTKIDKLQKTVAGSFGAITSAVTLSVVAFNNQSKIISTFNNGTIRAATALQKLNIPFLNIEKTLTKANIGFANVVKGLAGTIDTSSKLARASVVLERGLFGLAINTGTLGAALVGLGTVLNQSTNAFADAIGQVSIFAGILLGSFSVVLTKIILDLSNFAFELGTSVVNAAKDASAAFADLDKSTFVFNRTVEGFNRVFGDAIGNTETWTKTIEELGMATGLTTKELRRSTTEIIQATSQMGLNEEQMKKLLKISVDYAAQTGKDTFQATVDFITALNGGAQSVIKYGVKLNEASVQQKLYKEGSDTIFKSLSDGQKIQARYNALLTQYAPIAGVAADITKTLAGQEQILETNVARVNEQFGKGTAIIERSNIVNFAYNKVLGNINDNVIATAGFLTALGGRFLQVAGFVGSLVLKLLLLQKAIKIVNILLSTNLAQTAFGTSIPFLNKSIVDLTRSTGASFVSFKSLTDIVKTAGSLISATAKNITAGFLGISTSALSFTTVIRGVFLKAVVGAKTAVLALSKAFLVLLANPVVLTVVAISAAIFGLFKGLQELEKQTGALSTVWEVFTEVLEATSSVLDPLIDSFVSLGKTIVTIANKAFGFFVAQLSRLISLGITLLKKNPFDIFGQEQLKRLEEANKKLVAFGTAAEGVDFDLRKLNKTTKKASEDFKKLESDAEGAGSRGIKELESSIKSIETRLRDFGKGPLEIAKRNFNEEKKIVEDSLNAKIISREKANETILGLTREFQAKRRAIAQDAREKRRKELLELERLEQQAAQRTAEIRNKFEGAIGVAAGDPLGQLIGGAEKFRDTITEGFSAEEIKKFKTEIDGLGDSFGIGIASGFATKVLDGASGAKDLIVGGATALVDTVVPGLGKAVGPIFDAFAQGPEATKAFVKDFTRAIPNLIKNIILAAPAFIEAIIEEIPILVESLILAIPEVIDGFVAALPRIIEGLIRLIPRLIQGIIRSLPTLFRALIKVSPLIITELVKEAPRFITSLVKNVPQIVAGLAKGLLGLGGIFKGFGSGIFDTFRNLLSNFNPINIFRKIFRFDGGGRGAVEKFLGFDFPFIKFAKGGLVGGRSRVRGDSQLNDVVPAMLSPGEVVLPRSVVNSGPGAMVRFLQDMGLAPRKMFLGGLVGGLVDFVGNAVGTAINLVTDTTGFVFEGITTGDIDRIRDGLRNGLDEIGSSGFELSSNLLSALGIDELNFIPNPPRDLLKSLRELGANLKLSDVLSNPVRAVSDAVRSLLDTTLGGPLRSVLKAPGLQQGGTIPQGFPNDSFIAGLTSGETVVPRDLTQRLDRFINNNDSSPGESAQGLDREILFRILEALERPLVASAQVDFNEDTLADIILTLNRGNKRLA